MKNFESWISKYSDEDEVYLEEIITERKIQSAFKDKNLIHIFSK